MNDSLTYNFVRRFLGKYSVKNKFSLLTVSKQLKEF